MVHGCVYTPKKEQGRSISKTSLAVRAEATVPLRIPSISNDLNS